MAERVRHRTRRGESLGHAFWSLLAVGVALVFVFPLYWGVSTSLRRPIDTFTVAGVGLPWIDFTPTLANWQSQLALAAAQRGLANSAIVSIGATLLALALGLPAAYALARFRFSRRLLTNRDITLWFLSQRVLPPVATVIPFYLVMRSLGLLDTQLALILANATFVLPFVVIIMRQAFLDLPVELEEAALVDGADVLTTFVRVALPLAAPAAAATGLIIFAFAWNEFLFAMTMGSKDALTITVHIAGAIDTRGVQYWYLATRAILALVPPVVLALLAQRYIVRGLTLGAVNQ